VLFSLLTVVSFAGAADMTMVVCAPGYPGSTEEAQPAMDGLDSAVTDAAGWSAEDFGAVYFATEAGGVARIGEPDTGLALVTLPFFLEHHRELDLRPEMLAVPTDREAQEPWTLVAGAGAVGDPADLEGWQVVSLAGHSERFVKGPALADWGELPDSVEITFSGAVLSSLRKAAKGEPVAVLLDAEQADALDRLPFADDLEIVHRSQPLPVSVLCGVGDRPSPETMTVLSTTLDGLDESPDAVEALAGVRLDRFEPMDHESLQRVEEIFEGVGE
jgi:hypothetical protein